MTREIFLDNNATTQPLECVRDAILAALGRDFGNPSSSHSSGDRVRRQLAMARSSLADLVGATEDQVIFTSGCTEANNWVLSQRTQSTSRPRIVTSTVEHSSILETLDFLEQQGVDVVRVPVASDGTVDLDDVSAAVTPETTLVSIQWANNETGVLQPIEGIISLCRDRDVLVHTDAAQAIGKVPIDVQRSQVDFLSLTAHKFHGPQGVGALICRTPKSLAPQFRGGSQENGLRAGTENVPGIVGTGAAANSRVKNFAAVVEKLRLLRDRFEEQICTRIPGVHVNGSLTNRVCNTTNLRFEGVDGEAMVARLDQAGVRCSQSSACTNQRPEPSYVLRAMGLSEQQAWSSLRFSFSELNTQEDVDLAVHIIANLVAQLRSFSGWVHNLNENLKEVG